MNNRISYRRTVVGLSLGVLVLAASPVHAVNDLFDSSCPAPCLKPPKESIFIRGYGDLDAAGSTPTVTATLAKGQKKTLVEINVTFQWFALGGGFRPMVGKLNNKFPAPNFVIINWLDSCSSGMCTSHTTYQFDLDEQELLYPGQFYGQPLTASFLSARAVDANSQYQMTMSVRAIKKK